MLSIHPVAYAALATQAFSIKASPTAIFPDFLKKSS